jgi:hypothetical protein
MKGDLQIRIARNHPQAKRSQIEIANDFRAQHTRDVGSRGRAAAGRNFFGDATPSNDFAPLKDQRGQARPGEIGRSGKAIVPRSNHDRVVALAAGNSKPLNGTGRYVRLSGPST